MKYSFKLFYLLSILVIISCLSKEKQSYQTPIFENIQRDTQIYSVKGNDTLGMDIFFPEDDPATDRAVILYVHGGGFSGGRRDDSLQLAFCRELAKYGYVAVTMSYRLTMKGKSFHCDQPAPNKIGAFQSVVEDILSATRFLMDHQHDYGLNPDQVVLVGSSAGAEAVLHAVYGGQNGEILNSYLGNPGYQYAGVISMAGAVVDSLLISDETAIPTQLFHGTCDQLVPYASAPHHYCESSTVGYLPLHGAYSISERLRNLDKSYYLHTTCNGGHELASQPMRNYFELITEFLYQDVIQEQGRQIRKEVTKPGVTCELEATEGFCN